MMNPFRRIHGRSVFRAAIMAVLVTGGAIGGWNLAPTGHKAQPVQAVRPTPLPATLAEQPSSVPSHHSGGAAPAPAMMSTKPSH